MFSAIQPLLLNHIITTKSDIQYLEYMKIMNRIGIIFWNAKNVEDKLIVSDFVQTSVLEQKTLTGHN